MTMQDDQTVEMSQGAAAPAETAPPVDAQAAAPTTNDQQSDNSPERQDGDAEDRPRDERGRFRGVQTRIDELTRQARQAERDAAYWRALAESQAKPAPGSEERVKPTPGAYSDYADYVEALTEWKADEKVRQSLSARDAEMAQRAAQQAAVARVQTFEHRVAEVRTAMPDFDRVVGSADTPVAPHLVEAILDSDVGPQLAYLLAKNPAEAERLSRMAPATALREIGRLEASIVKPAGTAPAAAARITNAPPPTRPASSGTARVPDLAKASMDEYVAARRAMGARF
jgi:hypothetical protein